jgi:hypothetical protein
MAQTIQLKRGGVGALSTTVTANIGEVLIVTGSANNLEGPFLVVGIGNTSASLVNPVQLGGTPPSLNDNNKQLNGAIFYDTGSNRLYRLDNSGNTEITLGSLQNEARFALTGSTNFFKDAQFITGSTLIGAPGDGTGVASQQSNNYALVVSQSAYAYNHNVGYPTSNAWKDSLDGSYFNNFDANSDISEVLRFVAGLLSASAPSPSPNTQTFGSITSDLENNADTATVGSDYPAGNVPSGTTDAEVLYTIDKGFSAEGKQLFENVTVTKYNNPDIYIRYNGNKAGSTTVSSNANFFGAGGLTNGAATNVRVTGSISYTYEDNNSNTSTATSSSQHVANYTNSTFGTQNGISVGKINTDNPSVIPPAFQDMDFANFADSQTKLFNTSNNNIDGRAKTDISSSGYYRWQPSIAIQTGSQLDTDNFSTFRTGDDEIFWMPPNANIFNDLDTALSSNVASFANYKITSESFTSRSLSGAPYINGGRYDYFVTCSDAFNPLYSNDTNIATRAVTDEFDASSNTNGTEITLTNTVFSTVTQNASNGQISQAGFVFNGNTDQNGSVPNINSEIRLKSRTAYPSVNGTATNVQHTTSNFTDDDIKTTFTVEIIGSSGTETNINTGTNLEHRAHIAGHFGQSADSGSMGVFLSNDDQDESDTQVNDQDEKFLGEKYRRDISDCAFASDLETAFNSGSRLSNSAPRDCQVKPGFLVIPGSNYGYWYPSSYYNAANYYWYLREFDFGSPGSQGSITVTLTGADSDSAPTLTALTDTSTANTLSVGLIFESGIGAGAGSRTEVIDLTRPGSATNDIATGNSNPFSSNINIKGWSGGSAYSSNSAQIVLSDPANLILNNTNNKIWALVRMRGNTGGSNGLENIRISYSA